MSWPLSKRWTIADVLSAGLRTLALSVIGLTACVMPAAAAEAQDTAAPIDRVIERAWPEGAGGTVIVANAEGALDCRGIGFANRSTGVRARCDTVYDVMSMTKQFTAAAIVKLDEMGELRVHDRLGRFFRGVPPDKRAITLHDLLTHTSGLRDALGDDYERLSRGRMLRQALASRLRTPPGAEYRYSNLGYSVLAAVVERASGMSYERFLHRHLFAPAGMNQTGYVLPEWSRRRVAVEYDERGRARGRPFDHPWGGRGPYWNLRGNGGMLSTARDMVRWHLALEGDRVLGERAKRKLFRPYVREEPGGDSFAGYGWVLQRTVAGRLAWHDGGNGWSLGLVARVLDDGAMTFWVSNNAYRRGSWNLERSAAALTLGLIELAQGA